MGADDQTDPPYGEPLTGRIIGLAIGEPGHFGPGLLELVYETCPCHALGREGIAFDRQVPLPVTYQGGRVEFGWCRRHEHHQDRTSDAAGPAKRGELFSRAI